jgi:hypothetical protein
MPPYVDRLSGQANDSFPLNTAAKSEHVLGRGSREGALEIAPKKTTQDTDQLSVRMSF